MSLIKSKQRIADHGEVFTPAWMVEALPLSASAFDWTFVAFSSLFLGVGTAIRGVVVTAWYFDCRALREGADLEARLAPAAVAEGRPLEGAPGVAREPLAPEGGTGVAAVTPG